MIFAFLGALFYAIANTISKYVSVNFNIYKSFIIEYFFVGLYGAILIFFFDRFNINFASNYIYFIVVGISGFLGTWSLYMGMRHFNNGIVILISYLYVIGSYFLNNYLLGDLEKFSNIKLFVAAVFFILIIGFLFEKKEENSKFSLNSKIIFPLLTAISWTIYASYSNFLVRTEVFSPVQGMFYCEFFIGIISVFAFAGHSIMIKEIDISVGKKQFLSLLAISFFLFVGALGMFFGYKSVGGNYVNIISLVQVPIVSILSFVFLKDNLNKIQIITMIAAFLDLAIFVVL